MSASKFAIFFIVLVCLASLHECANLEKKPKGTCSKTPKNVWCCSSTTHCRSTKAECDKICIW
ncbi:hypothetical protein Bca101_067382 [Brassica carinata]